MKIELKKISFNERMSEETNCFIADLYINGKKVGYCKNAGTGGCTDYNAYTSEDRKAIAEAEAHCKTIPNVWESNLEGMIDQLLEDYLNAKAKKRINKLMEKAILWGVPNSGRYTMIKYIVPLSHVAKAQPQKLQETIDAIKKLHCAGNVQILNTNLEALGIQL